MFPIEELLDQLEYELNLDDRCYTTDSGINVPRVTDILSKTIFEPYLLNWANSLGFKHLGYTKTLNEAANYGSHVHSLIEHFYKGDIIDYNAEQSCSSFMAFLEWYKAITANNKVSILLSEEHLVCQYFGGTLDTLLDIGGKKILIDYKTSNHIGFKYFLQAAAYRYMLYVLKGITIDGIIILRLDKKEPIYEEYFLDLSKPEQYTFIEQCTQTFLACVYNFYNTTYISQQWDIFKKEILSGGTTT